ncbi:MAG: alanine dehydrogenase [Actinobacteria bacterium]|nr:alanine dehydrogenase [Actinomycetota bacterium]
MVVGVPTEMKESERRVGLTPDGVGELLAHDQIVLVESGAGRGIGADDEAYRLAGARIVEADAVWADADLVVKVKEPLSAERAQMREGQTLFAYLHLAPDPEQAADLVDSKAACIAYETVTDERGGLPMLAPMSKVAGRMAVQAGAHCLESPQGGSGILLGGVAGVPGASVVVIGGGVVGENATAMAVGLGAEVTVLDRSAEALDRLEARFGAGVRTVYSTSGSLDRAVVGADLVIGAVLVKGARAPRLVTRDHIARMRPGSVLVDVAIDQGGCFETSRPTTHRDPTFVVDGVIHYCVANMPGAVAATSTAALTNSTLGAVVALATKGTTAALRDDPHLRSGLNVYRGAITDAAVAAALDYPYVPAETALGLT